MKQGGKKHPRDRSQGIIRRQFCLSVSLEMETWWVWQEMTWRERDVVWEMTYSKCDSAPIHLCCAPVKMLHFLSNSEWHRMCLFSLSRTCCPTLCHDRLFETRTNTPETTPHVSASTEKLFVIVWANLIPLHTVKASRHQGIENRERKKKDCSLHISLSAHRSLKHAIPPSLLLSQTTVVTTKRWHIHANHIINSVACDPAWDPPHRWRSGVLQWVTDLPLPWPNHCDIWG